MSTDVSPAASGRAGRVWADLALSVLAFVVLGANVAGPLMLAGPFLIVVAAIVVATIMLRHRALALSIVLAGVLVAFFPQCGAVLAVVAYTVGSRELAGPRRATLLTALVAVPALMAPVGIAILDVTMASYQAWTVGVVVVIFGVVPALIGILVRQRRGLATAEQGAAESLHRAHVLAVSQAGLRERTRIAVEMHDLLGHRLSLISLHAGGLELATAEADPEAHRAAQLIRASARQALDELRGILDMLRTGEPGDPVHGLTDETGTRADVTALLDGSRTAGLAVTFDWTGEDLAGADENVRRAVHLVVREALTNVHKHAPGAQVNVLVTRTHDRVRVEVTNGEHPVSLVVGGGAGLAGLAERVRLLGGVQRAEPTAEGGFTVVADLPLDASARHPVQEDPAVTSEPPAPMMAVGTGSAPPRAPESGRSHRTLIIVVASLVGLFALAGLGSTVSGLMAGTWSTAPNAAVPQVGMALRDFVDGHGVNDAMAQLAARGQEPAPPAEATCLYQPGTVVIRNPLGLADSATDEIIIHRYCFVDNRLVDVRDLRVTVRGR